MSSLSHGGDHVIVQWVHAYRPLFVRYVEETALGKAREVALRLADRQDWVLVVGADTVVVMKYHCCLGCE